MREDDFLWCLSWSAALTPDLPMIPNRSVFLCAPHGRSLTATVDDTPSLLLSFSASSLAGKLCGGVEYAFTISGLTALPLLLSSVAGITLRSLRRFDLLTIIDLFGAVTSLLLILLAIQLQGNQIGIFLLASTIAGTLTLVVALLCIMRLLPMRQAMQPGTLLLDRLTRGLNNSTLLFTLDVIVWQGSEMLLLAHGHSSAELGFYALSSVISAHVIDISPADRVVIHDEDQFPTHVLPAFYSPCFHVSELTSTTMAIAIHSPLASVRASGEISRNRSKPAEVICIGLDGKGIRASCVIGELVIYTRSFARC